MKRADFIILSGATVAPDLAGEFGNIPPSFLPDGIKKLYEAQIARANDANLWLTLPVDFDIPPPDQRRLQELNVRVIRTDERLSLGSAIATALKSIPDLGRVQLLFGDTLVRLASQQADTFAVSTTKNPAGWTTAKLSGGKVVFSNATAWDPGELVVAGYFDFSCGRTLLSLLTERGGLFESITAYSEHLKMRPVMAIEWMDYGHIHGYFQARQLSLSARAFNSISSSGGVITKTGSPARKIYAEALWYESAPRNIQAYLPKYYGMNNDRGLSYDIEYINLASVSELFVHGRLPLPTWQNIVEACIDFIKSCTLNVPRPHELPVGYADRLYRDLFIDKTAARISEFCAQHDIDQHRPWIFNNNKIPSIFDVSRHFLSKLKATDTKGISFWHGDFHFANTFFDFRAEKIKTVDPRGMLSDGMVSHFGDVRYDIAKLGHSAIGFYDLILAGHYVLYRPDAYNIDFNIEASPIHFSVSDIIQARVIEEFGVSQIEMKSMIGLLFLSMIPLHFESKSRQFALLANAFRMFADIEDEK
ncbi:MAG: hypothetical protein ACK4FG_00990 [Brevundimonas sp.]